MSILAFLSRPERGEVEFDGKPVEWKSAELQLLRRKVTLLHQSPYLFTGTVFGNIAYGLKLRGQTRRCAETACCRGPSPGPPCGI